MKTLFVNYANQGFLRRQRRCSYSAIVEGKMDYCLRYGASDLSPEFVKKNNQLLKAKKGAGFWVWKPHIIRNALAKVDDGDAVIYCDSGCLVTGNLKPLVETCATRTRGILGFEVGKDFLERQWTKRDVFVSMDCEEAKYWNTPQIRATTIIFIKCKASLEFLCEWQELVCDEQLVCDHDSTTGQSEFHDFREHRHDQSLFSLLYKKHDYASFENLCELPLGNVLRSHVIFEPSLLRLMPSYLHPLISGKIPFASNVR